MSIWLRNSEGNEDALLSLAALSVLVVLLKVIVAGVTFTIGVKTFNLGLIPTADIIGALLAPTLGAYVMRRYTSDKFSSSSSSSSAASTPATPVITVNPVQPQLPISGV